jgi:autonomous glycyl radical cofactor GrcA
MIDEIKLEKAMNYLAMTDQECAEAKANVARTEFMAKVTEALSFKMAEGNIEARKAEARVSPGVREAWEAHFKAIESYEVIRARRQRAELVVDIYRTQSANRRQAA